MIVQNESENTLASLLPEMGIYFNALWTAISAGHTLNEKSKRDSCINHRSRHHETVGPPLRPAGHRGPRALR